MNETPTFFVGIDQASLCGYAVIDAKGRRLVSGVWDLSLKPGQGAGYRFVRFTGMFRQLLDSMGLDRHNSVVFYEQPIQYGRTAAHGTNDIGPALVAHITYQCELRGIPYAPIANATAKKAAGHGKASKLDMVKAANERWNLRLKFNAWRGTDAKGKEKPPTFPGGSDNEADALWIAEAGRVQALAL